MTDIFTRLSVSDSPKGSSDTFKTCKNISQYFKRRGLIKYYKYTEEGEKSSHWCCVRTIRRPPGRFVISLNEVLFRSSLSIFASFIADTLYSVS